MIAHLSGILFFKGLKYVIIDVAGVGYRVFLSERGMSQIAAIGSAFSCFTYHHQRENVAELYGFGHLSELDFFEALLSVSGVGPRSALAIMGVAPVDHLKRAIAAGDIRHLTKVAGVGKKTAEKIVVELRDKLGRGEHGTEFMSHDSDAIEALVALGYSLDEARTALHRVPDDIIDIEKRVSAALKLLGTQ